MVIFRKLNCTSGMGRTNGQRSFRCKMEFSTKKSTRPQFDLETLVVTVEEKNDKRSAAPSKPNLI